MNCVIFLFKYVGNGNNVWFEVVDDIWLVLSSNGLVKNDNDRIMIVVLEIIEMFIFEELLVVDDFMFVFNSN